MAKKPGNSEVLYVGTKRHITALSAATGVEIWRAKLPQVQTGGVICVLVRGERIYAAASGHVYCLARSSGEILWENELPKLGYQPVILAMEGADTSVQSLTAQVTELARQAADGAAAAAVAV